MSGIKVTSNVRAAFKGLSIALTPSRESVCVRCGYYLWGLTNIITKVNTNTVYTPSHGETALKIQAIHTSVHGNVYNGHTQKGMATCERDTNESTEIFKYNNSSGDLDVIISLQLIRKTRNTNKSTKFLAVF